MYEEIFFHRLRWLQKKTGKTCLCLAGGCAYNSVANGKIYVGSASHCDKPLTRGSVTAYDQATGSQIARFYTVPDGYLGGGVWSRRWSAT